MNRKRITLNLSLLVFVFSFMFFFGTLGVSAKESTKPCFYQKYYTEWLHKPPRIVGYVIKNSKSTDEVTATSSDTSISEVEVHLGNSGEYDIIIKPKKAGTFTITAKIKRGSKTYTTKTTAFILKYKNPIKILKIGNDKTNYAKLFAKEEGYRDGLTISGKKKITVTTQNGYKVTDIQIYYKNGKYKSILNYSRLNYKAA